MSDLTRCLGVLAEPPGAETARIAAELGLPAVPQGWEYNAVFLEQLYPYASVYLDVSGQMGGEARDRIAGFWRALGQTPPAEPDHLGALLGAYASLKEADRPGGDGDAVGACERVRAALLWEHLLSWLPLWLAKLQQVGTTTYRAWGATLRAWLDREAAAVPLPQELPLHLRDVPTMPRPDDGGEAFLEALLCPVRAGFIVTRSDLADLAAAAGLALRAGERRYALRALLAQDPGATLRGLAQLAESSPRWSGSIGEYWRDRSQRSAQAARDAAHHIGS